MKILIVDDEALARVELRALLSLHRQVTVVGEADTVEQALALTASTCPDIVLLDINLCGQSGFDYIAALPTAFTPRVIFVTAYDRHALRAFECNALDYLLKPVVPERLEQSLRRLPEPRPTAAVTEDDVVFVKAGSTARLIAWSRIQCITASGNYTHLELVEGSRLIVLRTLKQWLAQAPAEHFCQVHRSAVVQRKAIAQVHLVGERRHSVLLKGGRQVPVGRAYIAGLRAALQLRGSA